MLTSSTLTGNKVPDKAFKFVLNASLCSENKN
jgi:hypothetical protein